MQHTRACGVHGAHSHPLPPRARQPTPPGAPLSRQKKLWCLALTPAPPPLPSCLALTPASLLLPCIHACATSAAFPGPGCLPPWPWSWPTSRHWCVCVRARVCVPAGLPACTGGDKVRTLLELAIHCFGFCSTAGHRRGHGAGAPHTGGGPGACAVQAVSVMWRTPVQCVLTCITGPYDTIHVHMGRKHRTAPTYTHTMTHMVTRGLACPHRTNLKHAPWRTL